MQPLTDTPPIRIPARTRRKAMDWSLVLMSQNIPSTVLRQPEGNGWEILVESPHQAAALAALRQYQVENRGWAWPPAHNWPTVRLDWRSLFWVVLLVLTHGLAAAHPAWEAAGVMDTKAVLAGEWWRIFTATQLHADLGHLTANLSIGCVLLALVMGRFGPGVGVLAAYLAGVGGNLFSLALNAKPFHGLGASGVVMGALGLLAAQSIPWRGGAGLPRRYLYGGLMAGVMLFVLYGLSPGSDLAAHFGGFVTGLLFGLPLGVARPDAVRHRAWQWSAGLATVAIFVATWWLALRGRMT